MHLDNDKLKQLTNEDVCMIEENGAIDKLIESLSMTFTVDGKRQRLLLIFYSFLVILK